MNMTATIVFGVLGWGWGLFCYAMWLRSITGWQDSTKRFQELFAKSQEAQTNETRELIERLGEAFDEDFTDLLEARRLDA